MAALGTDTGAAKFVASNYEYLSSDEVATSESFTIAGWVRPSTNLTTTQTIAAQDGRFWLGYDADGYYADIYQNGTTTTTLSLSYPAAITNTYDLIYLSYDGAVASLGRNNLSPTSAAADLTGTITNTLTVGADPSLTYYMDGDLDEMALWSVALSPTAINSLYDDGVGLVYDELGGALVNTDPSIFNIVLPSGGQGTIVMSATAGDVGVIAVVSVLVLLAIYTALRGMVTSARTK
jgi:hypothetical protein